jgi:hypothetical protein
MSENKENGKGEEFKIYKGVVHLKHTGTELLTDIVAIDENTNSVMIRNPVCLQTVATESGQSQAVMVPWLMTSKEDTVHIGLADVLFISECRDDIAEQHTQMFSSVILPKNKSKFIV